jgi:hypothetical protein
MEEKQVPELTDAQLAETSHPTEATPLVDKAKMEDYVAQLHQEQDLTSGFIAGSLAAIGTAVLWAVICVATNYVIGYMAIGVAAAVGFAIRKFGKGLSPAYGVMGAAFALLACALGNYLSIVGFAADELAMSYWDAVNILEPALVLEAMGEDFSPIDIAIYGIALYYGYRMAIRQVTEEEILENTKLEAKV